MTIAISKKASIRLWYKEGVELWKTQPRNEKLSWIKVQSMETDKKMQWYITAYEKVVELENKNNNIEDYLDTLSLSTTY